MTLSGGCEGYVALEGGEEAITVAERRMLRHVCDLELRLEICRESLCNMCWWRR